MGIGSRNKTVLRSLSDGDLLQELLDETENTSVVREVIRERMTRCGYAQIESWVRNGFKIPPGVKPFDDEEDEEEPQPRPKSTQYPTQKWVLEASIHDLAKAIIKSPAFLADARAGKVHSLKDPERAIDFTAQAADNPNVENELPESGHAFWRFFRTAFKSWVSRQRVGVE